MTQQGTGNAIGSVDEHITIGAGPASRAEMAGKSINLAEPQEVTKMPENVQMATPPVGVAPAKSSPRVAPVYDPKTAPRPAGKFHASEQATPPPQEMVPAVIATTAPAPVSAQDLTPTPVTYHMGGKIRTSYDVVIVTDASLVFASREPPPGMMSFEPEPSGDLELTIHDPEGGDVRYRVINFGASWQWSDMNWIVFAVQEVVADD